jgi:hypothetical protein
MAQWGLLRQNKEKCNPYQTFLGQTRHFSSTSIIYIDKSSTDPLLHITGTLRNHGFNEYAR